jgi:hypothetical protein
LLALSASHDLCLFLTTGIGGGVTTFSAFSLDAVQLWQRGDFWLAAGYVAASLSLSMGGLLAGTATARYGLFKIRGSAFSQADGASAPGLSTHGRNRDLTWPTSQECHAPRRLAMKIDMEAGSIEELGRRKERLIADGVRAQLNGRSVDDAVRRPDSLAREAQRFSGTERLAA